MCAFFNPSKVYFIENSKLTRIGVDFSNILRAAVLYKSFAQCLFVLTL
jgi:hypothetical protein